MFSMEIENHLTTCKENVVVRSKQFRKLEKDRDISKELWAEVGQEINVTGNNIFT
jgi:hypothetical protein